MPKAYVLEAQRKAEAQKRQLNRIVKILETARIQAGISNRKELAAMMDIEYRQLNRRYRGEVQFELQTLIALSDTLHLDAASRCSAAGQQGKMPL